MRTSTDSPEGSVPTGLGAVSESDVCLSEMKLTDSMQAAVAELALEPPHSGDFHETFAVPDGSGDVAVLVGDVTGHGLGAAEKAEAIREEAVAHLKGGDTPLETINAANSLSQTDDDRFSTLFVAKIDGRTGGMKYANAGHEPPLVTHADRPVSELATSGPPLGVLPSDPHLFEEHSAHIDLNETLVVTTDGVSEARHHESNRRNFFGHEQVISIVQRFRKSSPAKIVNAVVKEVFRFTRSKLSDDMVVLAVRRDEPKRNAKRRKARHTEK